MNRSPAPKRLCVEHLEDRCTPTFGVPWFDATSLTLSFVPDGTNISGNGSNLFSQLNSTTAQQTWQREILRAYQTWAVQANVNIGLKADGGQAMGTPGSPQEDIRFGDIRVGGRMLSAVAVNDNMAGAVPFDYSSATWAGDVVFNTRYTFGVGEIANQQRDLFSVILHEAGHSLGVGPNLTDPTSATYSFYQPRTGLGAADVTAIRNLYGVRAADAYEGAGGNGTTGTAYNLTTHGNKIAIDGDITQAGDVDYFTFITPSAVSGASGLTVRLNTAGLSLLTGRLTVLDSADNVVGSVVTTDPMNNNLSIAIPNYSPSTTYRVKVEGAGSDVFSVGSYVLRLDYANGTFGVDADVTNRYYTNYELFSNDTQAAAAPLAPVRSVKANTFSLAGLITSGADADWYRITPNAPVGYTGTLYVGVLSSPTGLRSTVSVYNAAGQQLPSDVVMNENGVYQIQLAGQATGTEYFVRVASAATGSQSYGGYALLATLTPASAVSFRELSAPTMTSSSATLYSTMTVDGNRLSQFSLSATAANNASNVAVRVTIFDSGGREIFTRSVRAGAALKTGEIWLPSGTFTVVFNTATSDGSALPNVTFNFGVRELSDPIDPLPEDPTQPPPLDQPIVLPPPVVPPPPDPVVDPIRDPFLGLT
ncbi:MAG TPA: matrixin family metalloprotease [Gemmataceae bacterium]|nr:matrixin family metalloprotease [Gemmataceae bacterium]